MEKMITDMLSYHLEKSGKIASYQSGFRKGRSAMDTVIQLDREIRKAKTKKESNFALFFGIRHDERRVIDKVVQNGCYWESVLTGLKILFLVGKLK